jgi:protein-S-isoprenylcysteine O-methyltransferase Ste14
MNYETRKTPDAPGVIAYPPLIYAGTLMAGLLAHALFSIAFLLRPVTRGLGLPLLGGEVILGLLGDRALDRAGTSRSPYPRATSLATEGPRRFTRSPLYLGVPLAQGGIAVCAARTEPGP